jgi:hypothetical protein
LGWGVVKGGAGAGGRVRPPFENRERWGILGESDFGRANGPVEVSRYMILREDRRGFRQTFENRERWGILGESDFGRANGPVEVSRYMILREDRRGFRQIPRSGVAACLAYVSQSMDALTRLMLILKPAC